jgi:CRISPR-associated protein (TIGR02710 family)
MPPTPSTNQTALLLSVGLSKGQISEPVRFALHQIKPDVVWFFCSEDTSSKAADLYRETVRQYPEWDLRADYIEEKQHEELGLCYRTLRSEIPRLLQRWKINPEHVTVNYTAGTKAMSAALVLVAVEHFAKFTYVGAHQRREDGTGFTVSGQEKMVSQFNPWTELALREIERARDLWAGCNLDAAADLLESVARHHPQKLLFQNIAAVARGTAQRHRLDFKAALETLGGLHHSLPALFDGRDDDGLLAFVDGAKRVCGACAKTAVVHQSLLDELLDNTLRTASQNRFEDAAARLYRCMEMQLQIWLDRESGGLFKNGTCKRAVNELPPPFQGSPRLQPHPRSGEIELGMEGMAFELARIGFPRAQRLADDLQLGKESRLGSVATMRNKGILAHGVRAVGEQGFDEFKGVAAEFFGFELSQQRNPVPPLSPAWFRLG